MAGPVETKVQASTAAAAVSGLALWVLGHYVFRSGVPDVVASWVYVLVPAVITFAAGYLAKHTDRPVATVTVPVALAVPLEKTLISPAAAAAEQPPAAAGPAEPGVLARSIRGGDLHPATSLSVLRLPVALS